MSSPEKALSPSRRRSVFLGTFLALLVLLMAVLLVAVAVLCKYSHTADSHAPGCALVAFDSVSAVRAGVALHDPSQDAPQCHSGSESMQCHGPISLFLICITTFPRKAGKESQPGQNAQYFKHSTRPFFSQSGRETIFKTRRSAAGNAPVPELPPHTHTQANLMGSWL